MEFSKILKGMFCLVMLSCSSGLHATDCADVIWDEAVLDRHPNLSQYCRDVVEKNGKTYVQVEGKFLEAHAGKANIKLKNSDGSFGDTYKSERLSSSFRAILDGKPTRLRDIPRNSELTVLVPSDRFELVQQGEPVPPQEQISQLEEVEVYAPVATLLAFNEAPAEVLPSTASAAPMTALFGFMCVLLGALVKVCRLVGLFPIRMA